MKAFEFNISGYEARRNGNTLLIWELDSEGDRLYAAPLEITVNDLHLLLSESDRMQAYHNPLCSEVTAARTKLENARDKRTGGGENDVFDIALQAYTDVLIRHREASTCKVLH